MHSVPSELPRVIDNKYEVIALLGKGGMGSVYRVRHIFLKKECALKTLEAEVNAVNMRRFEKEAQVLSRLDHPNTVKTFDYGFIDGKFPYFVMELVEGQSLGEKVKSYGPISLKLVFDIFIPLCFALQEAHDRGITHRDIKPSNIMLLSQGGKTIPKLVDFGIARLSDLALGATALTQTGEIMGSPLYMSPEQCGAGNLDFRSDIYSLGCSLFEALTGVPPFYGANALATIGMHLHQEPPSLREASLGKKFSPDLEELVGTMLAKSPDDRYQSMTEVAETLMYIAAGKEGGIGSRSSRSASAASDFANSRPTPNARHNSNSVAGSAKVWPLLLVASAAICLTLAIGGGVLWWQGSSLQNQSLLAQKAALEAKNVNFAPIALPTNAIRGTFSQPEKQAGRDLRVFSFPDSSLGTLSLFSPDLTTDQVSSTKWPASGRQEIEWHDPLAFTPSSDCVASPRYFRKFKADELAYIDFDNNGEFSSDVVPNILHLTSLKRLKFKNTDFDDAALVQLGSLPNLIALDVRLTLVTGKGLAQFTGLKKLQLLKTHPADVALATAALAGSKALTRLELNKCGIVNDSDLKSLATCVNLEILEVVDNPAITDAGIENLKPLVNLQRLKLTGTSVTAGMAKSLSSFKRLQYLTVDADKFDSESLKKLQSAVPPGCKVCAS